MSATRRSFSILELTFSIAIIGALAAVAVSFMTHTRMDTQISMLKSDVSTLLKQVPAEVVAGNIDVGKRPPSGFKTWGDWLMEIGALDKARWAPTENGVVAVSYVSDSSDKNGVKRNCNGEYLYIDVVSAQILFTPKNIEPNDSIFCKTFLESYNNNSEIKIHLRSSDALHFN